MNIFLGGKEGKNIHRKDWEMMNSERFVYQLYGRKLVRVEARASV